MNSRPRILIVEDEAALRQGIVDLLAFKGMQPTGVANGTEGLEAALAGGFDLVVLDWMLPGMDGVTVCRQLRDARPGQAILMLTAKGREQDVLEGFEAGADDYVTKPFSLSVLMARVNALLRRSPAAASSRIELGCVAIDVGNLRAEGASTINLSPRDVELLVFLHNHRDRAISREELLKEIWGFRSVDRVETRAVDMHVVKLRRKLDSAAPGCDPIETVRGVGYRLVGA